MPGDGLCTSAAGLLRRQVSRGSMAILQARPAACAHCSGSGGGDSEATGLPKRASAQASFAAHSA